MGLLWGGRLMFLFITSKADSVYHGLRETSRYSSDFCVRHLATEEEVVRCLEEYSRKNQSLETNESGYSMYVYQYREALIYAGKAVSKWDDQAGDFLPNKVGVSMLEKCSIPQPQLEEGEQ
jgi:hypothetical protein